MTGTAYAIGSEVTCGDQPCGKLTRVIIDPIDRTLTHLVVTPEDRSPEPRLVPVNLVEAIGEQIRLACSPKEFVALESAVDTEFLPMRIPFLGYAPGEAVLLPYYGLSDLGVTAAGGEHRRVVYDRVPPGEVDIHRGEQVDALDGGIGRVQGLVVDPHDRHVTHVLLEEGRLWGKKEVAIPIADVSRIDGGVRVNLTLDQLRSLPRVEIDRGESR